MSESVASSSAEEHVDLQRLQAWLESQLGRSGTITAERMGQGVGVANALFDVRFGNDRYVLRRPPTVKVTASAGQTMREAWVLRSLAGTDVPHPRLIAACGDASVIGTPFTLMECVDGFTAVDPLPVSIVEHPSSKHALGVGIVDALAKLSTVDWRSIGLEGFGKPDGFLARQVERWLWQLDTYRTRLIPYEADVADWLRANLPTPGPIGVMHGDYSNFNVMYSHDIPPRLAAIVDWDTATIGEVLMDFGHLLSRWDEAGEEPTYLGSRDIADRIDLASRAEMKDQYAEVTGFDLSNIVFYQVLSLFKLGCILEGHYANAVNSGTVDAADDRSIAAPSLFRDALKIATGTRR